MDEGGNTMTKFFRVLALLGILLIIGANGFDMGSLFALIFIPLFFIGKPWYKYFPSKKRSSKSILNYRPRM